MRDAMSGPLSRRAIGFDRMLGLVLLGSFVALILGLVLPAITIRSMFLATDFSLLESVWKFLEGGDWFLFVITFLFSVAFPIVKILTGLALWFFLDATGAYARPVIGWLAAMSKWSMLDVFIIALIVLVDAPRYQVVEVEQNNLGTLTIALTLCQVVLRNRQAALRELLSDAQQHR